MKIFFNGAFVETSRETEDLWVKFNNGNVLDSYFDGLNLRDPSITARIIIEWASGKTTHELPLLKSFDGTHFSFTMPILEESGTIKITIRIYKNDVLTQPVIFTREIKESLEPSDQDIIKPEEWQAILNAIEENRQQILENTGEITGKLDKVGGQEVVYTNDENGNPSFLKYSVAPIKNQKTVAVRGEDGRLEIETPVNKQHAANKDYVDEAVLINKMPFTEVSKINYKTGYITYKINPKVVDYIDQTNLKKDGTIRVYFRIPEGCKYEDKGGNK